MFQPMSRWFGVAILAGGLMSSAAAQAQSSSQTVKVIVPNSPGGFIDSLARGFSNQLSSDLGQSFIVENKVGAGGKIGEEFVAASPPDGATLLVSLVLRPTLTVSATPDAKEMDVLKSLVIIGALASSPLIMSVPPSLGVKDFRGLIAKIKAEPGKHSYGSPGPGTPSQIAGTMIAKQFNLDIAHVPYRGGAAALPDLMSGVLTWMIDTPMGSGGLIESGKVVPMFVIDNKRLITFPEIPTLIELGYPQFDNMISTVFLMAPISLPKPMLDRLHASLLKAQKDPAIVKMVEQLRLTPPPADQSLEAAKGLAADQIATWEKTVKVLGQ
jgi:tripartite-type tricarboxylate transporter receptor subunit TctC